MVLRTLLVSAAAVLLAAAPVPAAAAPTEVKERPAFKPCPFAPSPPPSPSRKPIPVPSSTLPPPPQRPESAVGGEGLATKGLTLPPGVAPPTTAKLAAKAWVVADLDTGAVLGACAPHQQLPPASVQKLLLGAAVLGKVDPKQTVTITEGDLNFEPGSSAMGLVKNGKYTVETIWLGLFLNSGNDAANTIARLGGGAAGLPGGLAAMNAEAARLGAKDTHAVTPSGLDGAGQFSSAYDLALIARACFARDDFRRYATTKSVVIPAQPPKYPQSFQIQNDNLLLANYPGTMGGKTGFTDAARHTFVGAAERNGRKLVVTVLGSEAYAGRGWQQAATLLDWGFAQPKDAPAVGHLVQPGEADAKPPAPSGSAGAAPGPGGPAAGAGAPDTSKGIGGTRLLAGTLFGVLGLAVLGGAVFLWFRSRRQSVYDEWYDPPR